MCRQFTLKAARFTAAVERPQPKSTLLVDEQPQSWPSDDFGTYSQLIEE